MFIAPAAILGGFIVWLFGDPYAMLVSLDRTVLRSWRAVLAWVTTLFA